MAHDVFISYSHKDKPIADGICANLENAGVRCWIAPRDIAPGQDWPTAISNAIAASRIMVLVFSANSNSSNDVGRELILAANNNLIIIPFKLDNITPEPGKQYYLARTHWLDAMNPPTQEQVNKLVGYVKSFMFGGAMEAVQPTPRTKPPANGRASPNSAAALPAKKNRSGIWIIGVLAAIVLGVTGTALLSQGTHFPFYSGLFASPTPTATFTTMITLTRTPTVTPVTPTKTPRPTITITPTTIPPKTLNIMVTSVNDQLFIKAGSLYWYHIGGGVPYGIYINRHSWSPGWPDVQANLTDCHCNSSSYTNIPSLSRQEQTVSMEIVRAKGVVRIIQQPDASNDYTLVIEFNSGSIGNALDRAYEINIGYLTP